MEKERSSRIRSRKWKEVGRDEYEEGENMKVKMSNRKSRKKKEKW
jgi:hypothetical protein